ncbi:hypothetical protein SBF1_1610015 [Candidatus Desulfosporosinus infrequens]|uniref:Uncharacterized protein n=1 Tax=Candidatus Desulfosporosinus infrequens TaxID=2043169 RepID=A0A2U3KA40_9FIRM|nr:hypothetical protein SBF1_1610015 [Candidatus Desulfosporosinus infrequens]
MDFGIALIDLRHLNNVNFEGLNMLDPPLVGLLVYQYFRKNKSTLLCEPDRQREYFYFLSILRGVNLGKKLSD